MSTDLLDLPALPHYHFVLLPRFSLVAFSCALDGLRGANQILGRQFYTWKTVSPDRPTTVSTSDIPLITEPLDAMPEPDVIVICGGDSSHAYENSALMHWLRAKAKQGRRIGSISDGAFVAAEAGLFDKVPSTIHWKCLDAYRERFPDLDIKPAIMEISEKRFSCAGGTSSLDLMLQFVREEHGSAIASQIADNYFHDTIRDRSREQHLTNAFRIAGRNPLLADALLLMESHLETRLSIFDIAQKLKLSRRQLDRIFKRDLNQTPKDYYRNLRLSRASGLLIQTNMNISEIAVGCGFQSASHLGKYFTERFGQTPGQYRRQHVFSE
ncbi:MAG: GlxA family transcriptional regulator [Pseudomonadota bacterium]